MKYLNFVVALIALSGCVAINGNSSSPTAIGGGSSQQPSAAQIMDACMKVEVPLAMAGNADRAPMNAEDAQIYAYLICKAMSGCAKNPDAQGCKDNLKRYGFGN